MTTKKERRGRFRVGDRVRFNAGLRSVAGRIIEDRGPLGVGRRHLYRVEVPYDPDESEIMMAAENELEVDDSEPAPLRREEILDYLKGGGLLRMLHADILTQGYQPLVWITRNHHGRLTHTFHAERGMIGGVGIPRGALYEMRVYAPKRDEVVVFLAGFGLDRREADEVIRAIGTAP